MTTKPVCYYQGVCKEHPKYEVWFDDSGTLSYSRLCDLHYRELVEKGHSFDYVFDLTD
jgi:hypothetical protein